MPIDEGESEEPVEEGEDPHGLEELLERNLRGEMHEQQPEPGMIVDGKWELLRLLGEGGFGQVWEAWHAGLDHAFAIKFLGARHKDPKVRARFLEEARLMATMTSEHLVRVSDCGEMPSGPPYFVMELVKGETLRRRLRERVELDDVLMIADGILLGLSEVHRRGVVHGDIKPENIMLGEDGKVRLLDFGLAKTSALAGGGVGGTPPYMAVELLDGAQPSPRTDVYAVGVVLYEMLTARLPRGHAGMGFEKIVGSWKSKPAADPVRMHRAEVPESLERIVMEVLSREPEMRPKSVQALLDGLRGVAIASEIGAPRTVSELKSTHRTAVPGQRRRWWVVPGVIAAAVTVGVAGWWPWKGSHWSFDGEADVAKVDEGKPPESELPLIAADLEPARNGVLVVAANGVGEAGKRAFEKFCGALGGEGRVTGTLPVVCRQIPAMKTDALVAIAVEAGVKVLVLVEDEELLVRSTSHHRGNPVLAKLDGLPVPADASSIEQVAPVLRAVVGVADGEIPVLDWQKVGARWGVLAEFLRASQELSTHEDMVRALDVMQGQAHGFYHDLATLVWTRGVDCSIAEPILNGLSRQGEHEDAIRVDALLGRAECFLEKPFGERAAEAKVLLEEAFALSDHPCVTLASIGTISWIDRWNHNHALWEATEARLPNIHSCDRVIWNKVFQQRGDALVDRHRYCDGSSSYGRAYVLLPTKLEPLLRWAEYDALCNGNRGAPRQALLEQLAVALDSPYFQRPEQRVSLAYLRWWLTQEPAHAHELVERYAEIKEGDVALIGGVGDSDLRYSFCLRSGGDANCSFRILSRRKQPGDEGLLRASLGLR